MTAQGVFAERAAQASAARLTLYAQLTETIEEALHASDYDRVRVIRDELTQWAPWAISLPVWSRLYEALSTSEERAQFEGTLEATRRALRDVLEKRDAVVPAALFGDVSEDVERLKTVA